MGRACHGVPRRHAWSCGSAAAATGRGDAAARRGARRGEGGSRGAARRRRAPSGRDSWAASSPSHGPRPHARPAARRLPSSVKACISCQALPHLSESRSRRRAHPAPSLSPDPPPGPQTALPAPPRAAGGRGRRRPRRRRRASVGQRGCGKWRRGGTPRGPPALRCSGRAGRPTPAGRGGGRGEGVGGGRGRKRSRRAALPAPQTAGPSLTAAFPHGACCQEVAGLAAGPTCGRKVSAT
jgi:hypothetical protein